MAGSTQITDWFGEGVAADLPVPATLDALLAPDSTGRKPSAIYYAYDTTTFYVLNRDTVAWDTVASGGGGSATPGALDDPLFSDGAGGFVAGGRSGDTTDVVTLSGPPTDGNIAIFDPSGNLTAGGAPAGDVLTSADVGSIVAEATSGAANTPLFDDGAGGFTNGTRSGITLEVATVDGALIAGHLVAIDADGNLVDGGAVGGGGGGAGDVSGPASATDDHVATFDGATGTLIQDSGVAIADVLVSGDLAAGVETFLGTPTSVNLAAAVTDETGSGALVFATSPTLVTPVLGTPSSGNASNLTNIPVANATGILPAVNGGAGAVNGILKANGSGTVSAATAGTDYATVAQAKTECREYALSDETTAITTGTKLTMRMPFAMTLTDVRASLTTASASGGPVTVDIKESGTTIFSTKLTIDDTEKTSTTATAFALSDSSLADDAEITFIVDDEGSGATGLKVKLIGTRA